MYCLPPDCKAVLLVGEANFSFSVCLIKRIAKDVQITTSSFEVEEDVKRRLQGCENVKFLKQHGAEVLHQIDATRLHETSNLQGRWFDAIIFNFPHTGRKGSIKKNRQLIKDFFTSCSHQLTPNGRVLVSLCNGQGGTPMDTPQREWSNSWQVVAMAAFGGFILTAAIPFESMIPADYCNTGYRGQNKGFHQEGAVTHIFEKGLPLKLTSTELKPLTIITTSAIGRLAFQVPVELTQFIDRHLLQQSTHPLHITANHLLSALEESIPKLQELPGETLPKIVHQSGIQCPLEYVVEISTKESDSVCKVEDRTIQKGSEELARHSEASGSQDISHLDDVNRHMAYNLPSSLLQHCPCILATNPSKPVCIKSEVYHRCPIAKDLKVFPIMHQMLVLLPQQCCALWDDYEELVVRAIKPVLGQEWDITTEPLELSGCNNNEKTHCDINDGIFNISQHALCSLSDSIQVSSASSLTITSAQKANYVGICGEVTCTSNKKTAKFALLSLDHLVMHKFNISDIRLMWSVDTRQWERDDAAAFTSPVKATSEPLSKFPPVYTHDLSFWVNTDVKLDRLKFVSIVLSITGDLLEDLRLVDSYTDENTRQCSHCYRFVYRCVDRALSKDLAAQIQFEVRDTVSRKLPILLR